MIKEIIILLVGFIALGYAIPVGEEVPVAGNAVVAVADDLEDSDDLVPAASAWGGGYRRHGGWGRGYGGGWGGGWGGGYGGGYRHRGWGGGWGGGYGGGYYG